MKKIFENAVWWSGVVMVGLILGISLQFVRAWTEPTQAPPNGNVGAPINTSIIEQLKQGALGINGLLKAYNGLQVPNGNVGIGTASPGQKMQIIGGKAQADDFCLNSDPTKCLSTVSGVTTPPPPTPTPMCRCADVFGDVCPGNGGWASVGTTWGPPYYTCELINGVPTWQ